MLNNKNQLPTPEGHFFEDFVIGQNFEHGVPRTITESDATTYLGLTGSRFALYCAAPIAQTAGFTKTPIDNFLVFHIAFGKTVNDISLNAVANLGYANVCFFEPCFAGDTLFVTSKVIGLKENSSGKNGVVYVKSTAKNQIGDTVLSWNRWVMVNKKNTQLKAKAPVIPTLNAVIDSPESLLDEKINFTNWNHNYSDNQRCFDDFEVGNSLSHRDGYTINDSDHSIATRLYQNNARVHFDQHLMQSSHAGKRLVYGGHIISLCRTLSYNGLGNAIWLCGINGGTHCNPSYSGDTIYCHSQILDKKEVKDRSDIGLVRIRQFGVKNDTNEDLASFYEDNNGRLKYHSNVVLDFDYWTLMLKK